MSLEIKKESLESLFTYYNDPEGKLDWRSIYTLPIWMQTWWDVFGGDFELMLRSVWSGGELIGIAPLVRSGKTAGLLGSPDVCDYLDLVAAPGKEKALFAALLPELAKEGVKQLTLSAQRPDAVVFSALFTDQAAAGCSVRFRREDETYELPLASSWDDYLAGLSKKQRHEVRRKLRRLEDETESFNYRVIESRKELENFIPEFFELFKENPEKENFLTAQMERFFKTLITATAVQDLVRFGLLDVDGQTVAAVFYFNYRGRVYLYNSGYNNAYREISAGLLSKVLCIRNSIEQGCQIFDFLKGREVYKRRLGGRATPIYKVEIAIS